MEESKNSMIEDFMQILNCKDTVSAVTFLAESNWNLVKAMKAYQDKKT